MLKDPSIIPLVKEVVLMGGPISGGNVNGASEFNVFCDPEAADIVFNAGWPVTMVGLDVTEITLMKNADVIQLSKTPDPLQDLLQPWRAFKFVCTRGLVWAAVRSRCARCGSCGRSLISDNEGDACGHRDRRAICAARRSETGTAPLTGLSKGWSPRISWGESRRAECQRCGRNRFRAIFEILGFAPPG